MQESYLSFSLSSQGQDLDSVFCILGKAFGVSSAINDGRWDWVREVKSSIY